MTRDASRSFDFGLLNYSVGITVPGFVHQQYTNSVIHVSHPQGLVYVCVCVCTGDPYVTVDVQICTQPFLGSGYKPCCKRKPFQINRRYLFKTQHGKGFHFLIHVYIRLVILQEIFFFMTS